MQRAIALAGHVPGRPFAAVIVDQDSGRIIAEGWNRSSINPTWHGEVDAINQLVQRGISWRDSPLALYTTAEPCAMCQGAIHWTGIQAVFFGSSIDFLRRSGWRQIDIPAAEVARRTTFNPCSVVGGILEPQCNALFQAAMDPGGKRVDHP
jgi:tRNA(Arg) A34 adenosine deaminase TadA